MPSDRRLLSLIFLSFAVMYQFGNLSSVALACVFLSLGFAVLSLSAAPVARPLPKIAAVLLPIGLAATSLYYSIVFPHPVFAWTFAVVAVAVVIHMAFKTRPATVVAFVLTGGAAVAGIVTNIQWGMASAGDDVFHFQQSAAQALLNGQNPYAPLVESSNVLPPGVAHWILLHFPYGPVLPVLEAPFRLLGDIRILHVLAAVVLSAAVLALARRAGTFDTSACVVMAFPLTVGMALFGWVDIVTMAALATWFVSFRTHPRLATFALVIALAVKPTTLIALVPILFWSVRGRRQAGFAALFTAIFVLPFALITGLSQFYYDVLGVQLAVLPRLDSLTLNSFLHAYGLPVLPFAVSALVIGVTTVMVLRHRPATYGDLFTGTAILATVSFLVAKWAYFNYYYIPAVLLMLAVAGNSLALDAPEMIRPPAVFLASVNWLRRALNRRPRRRRIPGAALPARHGAGPGA